MPTEMMNFTFEDYKVQCDSVPFVFKKQSKIDVPDRLAPLLERRLKNSGVSIIDKNKDFKSIRRDARLAYLNGRLKTKLINFALERDEFARKGATLMERPEFEESLRWQKELTEVLNREKPIREAYSFKDLENGIQEEKNKKEEVKIDSFTDNEISYDSASKVESDVEWSDNSEIKVKKRRGRPKKDVSKQV